MSHFIKKCRGCGAVIAQCRCMDANKPVILGVCEKCASGKTHKVDPSSMKNPEGEAVTNQKDKEK